MSNLSLLYAFIGGAIVGAGAAVLFAPEKGEDIRARIADLLRKKGTILASDAGDKRFFHSIVTPIQYIYPAAQRSARIGQRKKSS